MREEYIVIIILLLEHHSDVNAKDFSDKTPLYYACDIAEKDGPVIRIETFGKTRAEIRAEIIDTLLQYGADVHYCNNCTGETILYHLINVENIFIDDLSKTRILELFLKKGADVNAKDNVGISLLHLAISKKLKNVSELLLKYNIDVNTIEFVNNQTPLHRACEIMNLSIVEMLTNSGANIKAKDKKGKTALHYLAMNNHFDSTDDKEKHFKKIIECLLKSGCNIDEQDNEGKTALHIVCTVLNYVGARQLIQHGADINIEDDSGKTPLSYCLFRCRGSFHQIYYYFDNHITKLEYLGYYVSKKNKSYFISIRKRHRDYFCGSSDEYLRGNYQNELKVMKNKRVANETLYDMLKKNLDELTVYAKNRTFKKIILAKRFEKKFPYFGYFLKLQYRKGCARSQLMDSARESLEQLIGQHVPIMCAENIFKYLNNENLNNLIKSKV